VRHVVTKIVAPFGPSIEERPPVPSLEEWVAILKERKQKKDERRAKLREVEAAATEEALKDFEGLDKVVEGLEKLKA
jgi:small subunit ribosomal protein S17